MPGSLLLRSCRCSPRSCSAPVGPGGCREGAGGEAKRGAPLAMPRAPSDYRKQTRFLSDFRPGGCVCASFPATLQLCVWGVSSIQAPNPPPALPRDGSLGRRGISPEAKRGGSCSRRGPRSPRRGVRALPLERGASRLRPGLIHTCLTHPRRILLLWGFPQPPEAHMG